MSVPMVMMAITGHHRPCGVNARRMKADHHHGPGYPGTISARKAHTSVLMGPWLLSPHDPGMTMMTRS